MENIPKILLLENIVAGDEVNLFLSFLHHPYYVQNRNSILHAFPQLKKLLQTTKAEEKTVQLFLNSFYTKNKNAIHKAIQRNKSILNQYSNPALIALLDIMSYHYNKPITYKAIPSILPFSPYKDNTFYFSILGEIKGQIDKNILIIGIHEISHFIFFDILKRIENTRDIKLPDDAKNYLKEALAVVILNQEPLCNILKLNNYKGNPEIRNLRIQKTNGTIVSFIDFIQEYYHNLKIERHKTFKFFLTKVVNIVSSITPELINKRSIWNQYGKEILIKSALTQIYSEPIKIKGGKD